MPLARKARSCKKYIMSSSSNNTLTRLILIWSLPILISWVFLARQYQAAAGRSMNDIMPPSANGTMTPIHNAMAWKVGAELSQMGFTGEIIVQTDQSFDQIRKIHFAHCHHIVPLMVVRPRSAMDVSMAVRTARKMQVEISVRSGGHSYTCSSVKAGSVQIDLRLLKKLDSTDTHMLLGSGNTWLDVEKRFPTSQYSYGHGQCLSVGVGGYLLGGGISGMNTQVIGYAMDYVDEYEMVTASGDIVRVTSDNVTWVYEAGSNYSNPAMKKSITFSKSSEEKNILMGLRAGGASFGIVTEFKYRYWHGPDPQITLVLLWLNDITDIDTLVKIQQETTYIFALSKPVLYGKESPFANTLDMKVMDAAMRMSNWVQQYYEGSMVSVTVMDAASKSINLGEVEDVLRSYGLQPSPYSWLANKVNGGGGGMSLHDYYLWNHDEESVKQRKTTGSITTSAYFIRNWKNLQNFTWNYPEMGIGLKTTPPSYDENIPCSFCLVMAWFFGPTMPSLRKDVMERFPYQDAEDNASFFDLTCFYDQTNGTFRAK